MSTAIARTNYANGSLTHRLIPGGAHTYSKGDDQFSANAPRHLERGQGGHVWDGSGREFIDWTSGLRTMSLGYGIATVIEAASEQMWKGSNFGRPSYIETEFAQDLIEVIPCAEMVKLGKNGSTVTSAAVKLARAYTGRDYVAICRDHPFFSYDDWFIGTTQMRAGIPKAYSDLSVTFSYNDIDELEALFATHSGRIACVIMEAATVAHPQNGFLAKVRDLCHREGALFIMDEMITGFRWHLSGAQAYYEVIPDLATFGKGLANGFAVSALVGKREIMELGGLDHDKERVFLISTTHGAENHALAAARATLKIFRENTVIEGLWQRGQELKDGLNRAASGAGAAEYFEAGGVPCSPWFTIRDKSGEASLPLRTLFLQEMVTRGVLINYLAPNWSHTIDDIARTCEAAESSLAVLRRAVDEGWEKYLDGAPVRPVFRQYN